VGEGVVDATVQLADVGGLVGHVGPEVGVESGDVAGQAVERRLDAGGPVGQRVVVLAARLDAGAETFIQGALGVIRREVLGGD